MSNNIYETEEYKTNYNKLLPFQLDGVKFLKEHNKCILADQPGLGKTIQVLMSLNNKAIIVCPKSLKLNWKKEVEKWRPDLKPIVLNGKLAGLKIPNDGEIIITNSDILPNDLLVNSSNTKSNQIMRLRHKKYIEDLAKTMQYVTLVIDEAHKFSNITSSRSCKIRWLSSIAGRTWVITGTPMKTGNRMKLFNMLCITGLMQVIFGTQQNYLRLAGMKYNSYYKKYEESSPPSPLVFETLKKYMLRRYKDEVAKDIPSKTYQYIPCDITDKQIMAFLNDCSKKIDYKSSKLPAFEEFSTARAVLAKAKLEVALDIVEEYEYNEIPLIVFCAHLDPLIELSKREGWTIITGQTSSAERNYIVENQSKYKGIALSLNCADVGLTLTHFSNALFIDLSWDQTMNDQATDRLHRISQTKPVFIKILVANHVLEHHVLKLMTKANRNIEIMINGLKF